FPPHRLGQCVPPCLAAAKFPPCLACHEKRGLQVRASASRVIPRAATAIRRRMDAHVLDDMAAGPEPHAVGVHFPVGQASSSAGSPSRVAKAPCYPSSVDAGWLPSRPASTSWRQGLWWIARSAA